VRGIFGTKRDEVTSVWRRVHIEELRNLYYAPHIITTITSKRVSLAGHIARIGESFIPSFRNRSEGKRQIERLRREGRIVLK
jgi:hypothetical protein